MAILHREKNRIAVLRFTPTTSEAALAVVPATKSFTNSFFCRSVSLRLLIRIADRIGDGSFLCQPLLKNGTKNGTLSSTIFVFPQTLVPPTGIEPVSPASEADGLSVDLRGRYGDSILIILFLEWSSSHVKSRSSVNIAEWMCSHSLKGHVAITVRSVSIPNTAMRQGREIDCQLVMDSWNRLALNRKGRSV